TFAHFAFFLLWLRHCLRRKGMRSIRQSVKTVNSCVASRMRDADDVMFVAVLHCNSAVNHDRTFFRTDHARTLAFSRIAACAGLVDGKRAKTWWSSDNAGST